jgi:DNA-binding winged helix-turn-helix (wHTH) protein
LQDRLVKELSSEHSASIDGAVFCSAGNERGVFAPLAMGSRALAILGVLVERPGELVTRAEILAAAWPGMAVEDSNLNVEIAALRQVLYTGGPGGRRIQTVRGRGYRFTAGDAGGGRSR